jgi:hypothetical protein
MGRWSRFGTAARGMCIFINNFITITGDNVLVEVRKNRL